MGQVITVSKVLEAADDNGICASQTPAGAGNLTINGALASGGVATMDTQRRVLITATGNESGKTFTLYGTNDDGASISEEVAGPNATTAASTFDFKTVTRVAIDAAAADAIIVGTNGVGSSRWIPANPYGGDSTLAIGVTITGTVNFTVEYTLTDDPCGIKAAISSAPKAWSLTALASKSADTDGQITFPVQAWRLTINSGTGTATARGAQQG